MPETGDPQWLVLLYAGGYNDLQPEIAAAVGELCSAPLPPEVELGVLANLAPEWMMSLLRPGHRPPAIALGKPGDPDPGVAALPRQLLVDHWCGTDPFLSEREASTRLRLLGWEIAAGRLAPPLPAAARRGFRP